MNENLGNTTKVQRCLERLDTGDESAREELVSYACQWLQARARRMLRVYYSRVRRWEETDDLTNRALLRLHQALETVRPTSVRHFLNLANKQIRLELIDLARHYFGPEGLGANHATDGGIQQSDASPRYEVEQETSTPDQMIEWAEFHEQVEALPEEEREVFSLHWYNGLTFVEIGELLEISDRTAKRRWRSACLILHKAMGGEFPGS